MSEETVEREERLAHYEGPDRIVPLREYLEIKKKFSATAMRFHSGFSQFDKAMEGLETSELTVISGHTRNGKTLFAESWLKRIVDAGVPGCYFSFEVPASKSCVKFLSADRDDMFLPIELKTMSIDWLLDRMEEAKLKYGCRVFVIDHLHFIVDMMTQQNMSLNIGAAMRRLKMDAANTLNVAVILIAHQGQANDNSKGEASLEKIRDSSFIAQEADNVVIVSRRKDLTNQELDGLPDELQSRIRYRMTMLPDSANPYQHGFATIQIAKARRSGAFCWSKLFQKNGAFLEEV